MQKLSEAQIRFMSEMLEEGVNKDNPIWFEVFPQEVATVRALERRGIVKTSLGMDEDESSTLFCTFSIADKHTADDVRAAWSIPEFSTLQRKEVIR